MDEAPVVLNSQRLELKPDARVTDLTRPERRTLAAFLLLLQRKHGAPRYLEIGIFGGGTLRYLKILCPQAQFTGVDLFEDFSKSSDNTHVSGTYSQEAVQAYVGDEVRLIKGDSRVVMPALKEKFHLIFIDGNHTYDATREDFNNAVNLLEPGGYIAFHNCSTWMDPDFDCYIRRDGGPWLVTQELIASGDWLMAAEADRLRVLARKL